MKPRLIVVVILFSAILIFWNVLKEVPPNPTAVPVINNKVTLSILHYIESKAKRNGLKALTDAISERHPDLVFKTEGLEYGKFVPLLKTRIAAGDAPDLFEGKPREFIELARAGQLLPLNDKTYKNNVQSWALEECAVDGDLYGIPISLAFYGIFFNNSLFEKYSIKVPTTLSELRAACDAFQKNGLTPFAHGFKSIKNPYLEYSSFGNGMFVQARVGDIYSKVMGQKAKFADFPVFRDSLDVFDKVMRYNDPGDFGVDGAQCISMLADGRRPMYITGSWISGDLYAAAPDGRFGFIPAPWSDDPEKNTFFAVPDDVFMVSIQSKKIASIDTTMSFLTSYKGTKIWMDHSKTMSSALDAPINEENAILKSLCRYARENRVTKSAELSALNGEYEDRMRSFFRDFASLSQKKQDLSVLIEQLDAEFARIHGEKPPVVKEQFQSNHPMNEGGNSLCRRSES